ncbi:MBOAT family O-acyltransferase [Hugenholtzia roseola]|uniref:MBOAT family O-acyltransferase n=1 Tax=Hugenholtzia roseola TaxID=1002 RepID=UPI000405B13B|nr:MBOAT family O-acyltransferase [Hugenholtzia roseola]
MVFASLTFLSVFLPLNLLLYYLFNNSTYRNILLTLFSLVFYAWGEPVWVILLIFSALVDYLNGLWIEKFRGTFWAKLGLISSLVINLSLLVGFKYSGFLYENINFLFGLDLKVPNFTLPVGISFYTFQTISYTVDLYRNKVKVQTSWLKFLLFVSLYPQLVAGPIVRYEQVADEIDHRRFNIIDLSAGIHRFCIGLFKKVFIANTAGEFASKYLEGSLAEVSISEGWFGICMFSLQIYFDFSGYSDMAIGLGRMFGFHYQENFRYPYISTSATEFWRRWYISLGSFFRDYVYIPLGGNKKNQYLNLFIVWFLTGLWHGASWNFVIWGLYFGVLITIEKLFLLKILEKIPALLRHLYLLFIAVVGWAIFYFTDFEKLIAFFKLLFGISLQPLSSLELNFLIKENIYWLAISLLLCLPIYPFFNKWFERKIKFENKQALWILSFVLQYVLLLVSIALLVGNTYNPFIYYRF